MALTCCFIHANIIHLLFNIYWLVVFGRVLEPWLKPRRYLLLFVVLAFGSGAGQFLAASDAGIGLSGVVYGYFGLLFATRSMDNPANYKLDKHVCGLFVGWFFLCILLTQAEVWDVGNAAHGSGAVLGYLIGRALLHQDVRKAYLAAVGIATVVLVLGTLYMPWDYLWWWHRGGVALDQAQPDRAYANYSKAVETCDDDVIVESLLDWLAYQAAFNYQKPTEAYSFYMRAMKVSGDPDQYRPYFAYMCYYYGDHEGALRMSEGLQRDDLDEFLLSEPEFVKLVVDRELPPPAE